MGVGSAALLPYDRLPGRMYGSETPNKSMENRYIYSKHASLMPTPVETQVCRFFPHYGLNGWKDGGDI
ncbi:unnamed protein product [Trichobilharzia regenti]|nr:unnamed protein product [Trichobilharzia regenti]